MGKERDWSDPDDTGGDGCPVLDADESVMCDGCDCYKFVIADARAKGLPGYG